MNNSTHFKTYKVLETLQVECCTIYSMKNVELCCRSAFSFFSSSFRLCSILRYDYSIIIPSLNNNGTSDT